MPTYTPRPTFTAAAVVTTALPTTAAVQASPTPATTDNPAPVERPVEGLSLTVLHTNDVYGYIDPCGWGVPKGGLARRVTWIKHELANVQSVVVVVDAGSSLLGEHVALQSEGRVMVEGMNLARYDAMAVGRMDALKGLEVLQARAAEAEFPFLSANLVDPATQALLFEPYTIIERGGARIGIVGISDEDVVQMPLMAGVATYLDATEAARRYVAELRDQVDVLIVLSRLGLGENKELAAAVPGINVIIGGKTRRVMNAPERVGDTLITEMAYNGERGGKLTAFIGADGAPYDYAEEVVNLTDGYADDREAVLMLDGYRAQFPEP